MTSPMLATCAAGREYDDGRRVLCPRRVTFSIGTYGQHIVGACSQHLAAVLRAMYDKNSDEGPFTVVPLASPTS